MQRARVSEAGSKGLINNEHKRKMDQEQIDREKAEFFAKKGKIEVIKSGIAHKEGIPFVINESSSQRMADHKVKTRKDNLERR